MSEARYKQAMNEFRRLLRDHHKQRLDFEAGIKWDVFTTRPYNFHGTTLPPLLAFQVEHATGNVYRYPGRHLECNILQDDLDQICEKLGYNK